MFGDPLREMTGKGAPVNLALQAGTEAFAGLVVG